MDLLRERLLSHKVADFFPNYDGDNMEPSVLEYFENCFRKHLGDKQELSIYRTCATDSALMTGMLGSIADIVMMRSMQESDFFK